MRGRAVVALVPMLLAGCGGGLLPAAEASPTASPPARAATLDVEKTFHAALRFQPAMDATGADFGNLVVLGDRNHNWIEPSAGSIAFHVFSPDPTTASQFGPGLVSVDLVSMPPSDRYVAQLTVSFGSGAGPELDWSIRRGDDGAIADHVVRINTFEQDIELEYVSPAALRAAAYGDAMGVSRVIYTVGSRPFVLTAVVDPPHYVIYLGVERLIEACDSKPGRYTPTATMGFTVRPDAENRGVATVTGIRVYALPAVLLNETPASGRCPIS